MALAPGAFVRLSPILAGRVVLQPGERIQAGRRFLPVQLGDGQMSWFPEAAPAPVPPLAPPLEQRFADGQFVDVNELRRALTRIRVTGRLSDVTSVFPAHGTPQTVALNQRLEQDHMPTTSPGFGISAAADGTRFPYLFPIAATYWSQGAASIKFAKDKLSGDLKGKKIAYVYYDNPAGKEPMAILEALQKQEGFEMRAFAVPPPGVELGAQILDLTQRYHPDFIIAHLFGRSPSVFIKGLKAAGFPLSKVVGLVWASAEADILAAGGWAVAEGYYTMQFAGAGDDYPIRQEIKAMYKKEGKEPPKEMDNTVIYNGASCRRRSRSRRSATR